jgi:thiamine biosynthesis lipoprotein
MLSQESKVIMKNLKFALICMLILTVFSCKQTDNEKFTKLEGYAFGTSFNITYHSNDNYTKEIDSLFHLINKSLSTYVPGSDISKINNGDSTIVVDAFFTEVFKKATKIYIETEGVFDPTIGVLVNAWGFGPKKPKTNPDSVKVTELLELVGFDSVALKNGKVLKENDSIYIDFNAIAKGYAVDVAGRFLKSKNVENYLVEIGGEIRTRGQKNDSTLWKAGIENPNFDGTRSILKIVELKDQSMATSGSYRKFKTDSVTGKKYVHIINPKTGYPTKSNLLSVSIISALDCADVDGYATALMAMPIDKAKEFLETHRELKGFLIYSNENGVLQTYTTENF